MLRAGDEVVARLVEWKVTEDDLDVITEARKYALQIAMGARAVRTLEIGEFNDHDARAGGRAMTTAVIDGHDRERVVPSVELRILPRDFLRAQRALIARETLPRRQREKDDDGHARPDGNQPRLSLPPILSTGTGASFRPGRGQQNPRGDEKSDVDHIQTATQQTECAQDEEGDRGQVQGKQQTPCRQDELRGRGLASTQ